MRRYAGAWLLLVLGLLPLPGLARSQGTSPLRKAELVRLLATGALKKRDIAALVRRNCVTFRPSERDRAELRAAGADEEVLAAVDQCLRARLARAAPPPPPPPSRPPPPRPRPAPAPVVVVTHTPADTPAAVRAEPPPPAPPPRPVISERLTQFTRGTGLHGTVGATLGEPLVLEVRDTAGAPVAGQPVTFAATGEGTVQPGAVETDRWGAAQVHITLGERAGPVGISATVGTFTRTVTVHADPGPTSRLEVERDGAPVGGGVVAVRSRDTLVLRVVARDAYGNEAALGDFTATTSGSAIALRSASATGSRAAVTLESQRTGRGELQISASGLQAQVALKVMPPARLSRPWGVGARAAWLGVNHPWVRLRKLQGISGADFTLLGRRTFGGGFSLALAAGVGSLSLDTTAGGGGSVSATL
ncbi:MAG TPA: Ig-like domain-containing protein, partial [Gemmatimonadales bacterium]|nr:Ig-like domain-containing protein [Gemmatimonadales bacterium]